MRIDCHVHLVGASESSGAYLSKKMRRSVAYRFILWKFGLSKVRDPAEQERLYVERLAALIRESEIDRAVLLAFDRVYAKDGATVEASTHTYVPNDYVARVCEAYPDLFLNGASIHPYRSDALDALERVRSRGAVLIKLLPNSQGFDPSDRNLIPYYQKMKELGLALLIHAGYEHTIPVIDQKLGFPDRLKTALDQGLKVIIAHAGTSGLMHLRETMGQTLTLLDEYPNCCIDTSALTNFWRSRYLIDLLNPSRMERKYGVVPDNLWARVIHGSDYPIPLTPSVFSFRMSAKQRKEIRRLQNPIESDVRVKRFLGVPDGCLTNAFDLFVSSGTLAY